MASSEPGSVVERAQRELERADNADYVTSFNVSREDVRALLAVVEAAQELSQDDGIDVKSTRAVRKLLALDAALAALQSPDPTEKP